MNRLISASAGSGKTYALTTQYLRLLRARHKEIVGGSADTLRVESLLAATFTRKAAGEIFDRVFKRLADAALDSSHLAEMQKALEEESLTAADCQDLLLHLCRSLNRVQIGTLDSFFQRLCQVYRQEAGLGGGLRMTDPKSPRCRFLQKEAVRAMLEDMSGPEEAGALFQTLTRQKASSSVVPKILSLLEDISETVEDAEPHHWEALQVPPPPASTEIDAALASLRDAPPYAGNGHWDKAVSGDLSRFQNGDWEGFCGSGIAAACLAEKPQFQRKEITAETACLYAVLLQAARHALLRELKARTLVIRDIYAKFSEKFRAGRRAEGLLLFSETAGLLTKILGDVAETARRLDAPLEHLLLDEFQDTSDPQWGLLQGFARHAARPPGSVFVVGDAKQAIYGWRGGRAEIFEQVGNDIPDLVRASLEKSYRSSEVVLNVVNGVFQTIDTNEVLAAHTAAAALWAAYFKTHEAANILPGFVELCVSPVAADPDTADDGEAEDGGDAAGASPHLASCAERMAGEIKRLLPLGKSVGVLVRTNRTLAQVSDLLRARGVPVSSEGVGKITDDPAVEMMLSGLLLADHPGHSAAAYHVAHSPLGASLGLTPSGPQKPDAARAAEATAAVRREILSAGYAGLLTRWAALLAPYGTDRTALRLEQILAMAAGLDALPPMRPSEFVRAVRESSAENPGSAPVRVMTINRAKGLEFDAVFLPDLEWKTRTPDTACLVKRASVQAISAGAAVIEAVYARPNAALQKLDPELSALALSEVAEEVTGMLCLLYVAMTRPRHALYLYVAPHRMSAASVPYAPGLKPAAILRAALCGSASYPDQGADWTVLRQEGSADWCADGGMPEPPAAAPAARPALLFRESRGLRRGSLPGKGAYADAAQTDTAQMAADLLLLS